MAKILNSYFPHDSNARTDRKIIKLLRIHGWKGYGLYFALIEILREQEDFRYPLNQISELEYELREPKEVIFSIINDFDLFIVDELNNFFSISLIARMQPFLEKSKRALEANRIRWNNAKLLPVKKEKIQMDIQMDMQMESVSESKENRIDKNRIEENRIEEKEYPPKQVPATVFSFDEFWEIYSKRKDRVKCEKKYKSISEADRAKIKDTLQKYIDSTPDIQFRKNPLTYLNSKTWEDEIQTTDPLWKRNSYRDKDGNIITPIEGNKNFVLRNGIETYVCR